VASSGAIYPAWASVGRFKTVAECPGDTLSQTSLSWVERLLDGPLSRRESGPVAVARQGWSSSAGN
jgi:hypothetical protein